MKILLAGLLLIPSFATAQVDRMGNPPVNDALITPSSITISGMTSGSVWFSTTSGNLWQSNAGLFFENTNTRLGVANASPAYPLDVTGAFRATGQGIFGGSVTVSGAGAVQGIFSLGSTAQSNFSATGVLTLGTALSVANGGTGATSLTDGGVLFGAGTGAVTNSGVLTNGQLLIGDGTTAPAVAALTGTANQITVTNGAGSITLATPQNIHTAATPQFAGLGLGGGSPATGLVVVDTVTVQGNAFSVGASTLAVVGGNVGIGTVAPAQKLHLSSGTVLIDGNTATSILTSGVVGINQSAVSNNAGLIVKSTSTTNRAPILEIQNNNGSNALNVLQHNGANTPNEYYLGNFSGVQAALSENATVLGLGTSYASGQTRIVMAQPRTGGGTFLNMWDTGSSAADKRAVEIILGYDANATGAGRIDFKVIDGDAGSMTTAQVIRSNGNIGIGTAGPTTKLHMSSGTLTLDGASPKLNIIGGGDLAIQVSSATTSTGFFGLAGAFQTLPTSGYSKGVLAYQLSDNKVYVSTNAVDESGDWQAVGAQ